MLRVVVLQQLETHRLGNIDLESNSKQTSKISVLFRGNCLQNPTQPKMHNIHTPQICCIHLKVVCGNPSISFRCKEMIFICTNLPCVNIPLFFILLDFQVFFTMFSLLFWKVVKPRPVTSSIEQHILYIHIIFFSKYIHIRGTETNTT